MQVRVGLLYFLSFVFRRAARRNSNELNQMALKLRDVLRRSVPGDSRGVATKNPSALNTLALPIHARVLEGARREVVYDAAHALLAAEPFEQRLFALALGGSSRLARLAFVGVFVLRAAAELLVLGHALRCALVRLTAA